VGSGDDGPTILHLQHCRPRKLDAKWQFLSRAGELAGRRVFFKHENHSNFLRHYYEDTMGTFCRWNFSYSPPPRPHVTAGELHLIFICQGNEWACESLEIRGGMEPSTKRLEGFLDKDLGQGSADMTRKSLVACEARKLAMTKQIFCFFFPPILPCHIYLFLAVMGQQVMAKLHKVLLCLLPIKRSRNHISKIGSEPRQGGPSPSM
jgi:hypothetical protein